MANARLKFCGAWECPWPACPCVCPCVCPCPLPMVSAIHAGVEPVAPDDADAGLDGVAVSAGEPGGIDHRPLLGQQQRRGHARCLGRAQPCGRMVEIALRACLDTISAAARLGDVEIDFHDPPLVPDLLDQQCEPGFQPFAEVTAALPQEDVLGGLLADRAAAADSAALLVAPDRLFDRLAVEAVMAAELAVFTGNHRRDHVAVDAAERGPGLGH